MPCSPKARQQSLVETTLDCIAALSSVPSNAPTSVSSLRRLPNESSRTDQPINPDLKSDRLLELIWLTGQLRPDFKTIADFRRDNGEAIRKVCAQFVALSREIGIFTEAVVAVDGSKFKAVNNRDKNFTSHKLQARMQQLEDSIQRYLAELDRADRQPSAVPPARVAKLEEKIATVKAQVAKLGEIEKQLLKAPDQQISLTDPDARSMATSGRHRHGGL